ncbi:potassium channel family protein [Salirhabdus sp. Marseille-P4669]|uniref:potassium channel family protein n=1 Tax=Salirhabdus sp. Marseille-P4669 TaxID=2042310 RepID=UPI000C7E7E93|nr:potassium channel family protein [Salirhabdus sp. Marseille-P4669]
MLFFRQIIVKIIKVNTIFLIAISWFVILLCTILIVHLDPTSFSNYFEGFWWVMTTVTTVGYGDFSPVTTAGRILAIFLYIVGIGLIGVVIGKVVDAFSLFRKKQEEGKIVYKGSKHYILIGWSKKAQYALKEMMASDGEVDIIIIDQLEKAPMLTDHVFYISGEPTTEDTLNRANIREAKAVLIFADDSIGDNQLVDGKTFLIASTVEALAPHVHTVVEIMEENHIKNFKHINVDEFIFSHETISSLAVRTAFTEGVSSLFSQLLNRDFGDDLYQIPRKKEWNTYSDAFHALLKEGATLIADGRNLGINRMLSDKIKDDARLFVICDEATYERLIK